MDNKECDADTLHALRLLDELAERAFATIGSMYSMSEKPFVCELGGTSNSRPVLSGDGHPVGRLVTCQDCNGVYERRHRLSSVRPLAGERLVIRQTGARTAPEHPTSRQPSKIEAGTFHVSV